MNKLDEILEHLTILVKINYLWAITRTEFRCSCLATSHPYSDRRVDSLQLTMKAVFSILMPACVVANMYGSFVGMILNEILS